MTSEEYRANLDFEMTIFRPGSAGHGRSFAGKKDIIERQTSFEKP